MPLHYIGSAALDEALTHGEVEVLRLTDGETECAYAIGGALEIIQLPAEIAPATGGPVLGIAVWEGRALEILDPLVFFLDSGVADTGPVAPLCLLDGAGAAWMDRFLRPVLEAHGYRCTLTPDGEEPPSVRLMMEEDAIGAAPSEAPVVRLRRDREGLADPDSIYRYDRSALIAAVAGHARRGGR